MFSNKNVVRWLQASTFTSALFLLSMQANALGTAAGTGIDNQAQVDYTIGGTPVTESSNLLTVTVAELLDIDVQVQTATTAVSPGATGEEILFTVTNTGNGSEEFTLAIDSALGGDDFDPTPSAPFSIYFDTDGSGDLSGG
ncbi:MAG: hypothetical protein HKM24_07330, partial [Gammaproteobacteria bacterium]|nr:hypothetical protein [Gammaproteobacteria bacterium]